MVWVVGHCQGRVGGADYMEMEAQRNKGIGIVEVVELSLLLKPEPTKVLCLDQCSWKVSHWGRVVEFYLVYEKVSDKNRLRTEMTSYPH